MSFLPPKVNVPATPALSGIDIRTLYDIDHATPLGQGGFSEVVAVKHIPTGDMRALKVMLREVLVGKKGEMVTHEKEILRRTCHPNIITLYETIQNPDKVYFALDLMNEDLFEFIVRNKTVNEGLTRKIMFELMSGINYLHEQSIVHRDVKPENILINVFYNNPENGSPDGMSLNGGAGAAAAVESDCECPNINDFDPNQVEVEVKLADFGLAKLVIEWDVRSTPCGTSFYIAPEVIRGIEEQGAKPLCTNQRLVKSVDVWSAGIVFYVLLCGRPPFHGQVKTGEERRALLRKIDHGVLFNSKHGWDCVSEDAKDLILCMLDQDSAARITAAEVLRHPFFTKNGLTRPVPGGDPIKRQREQLRHLQEAQMLQQQQKLAQQRHAGETGNENKKSNNNDDNNNNGEEEYGDYTGSGHVVVQPAHKKKSILNNVRNFFSGGGTRSKEPRSEEQQQMHQELANLQQDMLREGDVEGDETAYKQTMPLKESKSSKPAVMNPKAKVGPAALKK